MKLRESVIRADVAGPVGHVLVDTEGPALYAGTETGEVLKLDATDGTVQWQHPTQAPTGEPTAIDRFGNVVTVVGGDTTADEPYTQLNVRNAESGEVLWSDRRREVLTPLGAHGDVLFVSGAYLRRQTDELGPNEPRSRSGTIRALDLADGRVTAALSIDGSFGARTTSHGVYVRRVRPATSGQYRLVSYDLALNRRWHVDLDSQYATALLTTDDGVVYPFETRLVHWDAESGNRL